MTWIKPYTGYGAKYKEVYDDFIGNRTPCTRVTHLTGSLIMIALLVISSVAAAQAMPGQHYLWTSLGMGLVYVGVKCFGGSLQERKVDIISSLALASVVITFAALGLNGVLAAHHVGFALIGTSALAGFVKLGLMVYAFEKQRREMAEAPES